MTGCSTTQDDTKELYSSVVENYLKYTNDKDLRSADETNGMAFLYWNDYYDGLFSTQYDIDGDGAQELLISLRDLQGRYSLLDIYTSKNNSLIRLTNSENGLDMIGERMNVHMLDDGTLFYRGSAGLSGTGLSIYELNDEKNNYTKVKDLMESDVIELKERIIDTSKLEWSNIGITKVIPLVKYMQAGDYSSLEGKWKNEEGEIFTISEDKISFSGGETAVLRNPESNEVDGLVQISVDYGGNGPSSQVPMLYIPKEIDGDIPTVQGKTRANTERITISQAIIGSEQVFYRLE